VTDDPTPEDLDQLARSVAMPSAVGDRDRLDVVAALRRLADIGKAVKASPVARTATEALVSRARRDHGIRLAPSRMPGDAFSLGSPPGIELDACPRLLSPCAGTAHSP
jgi:hypothetical protein